MRLILRRAEIDNAIDVLLVVFVILKQDKYITSVRIVTVDSYFISR